AHDAIGETERAEVADVAAVGTAALRERLADAVRQRDAAQLGVGAKADEEVAVSTLAVDNRCRRPGALDGYLPGETERDQRERLRRAARELARAVADLRQLVRTGGHGCGGVPRGGGGGRDAAARAAILRRRAGAGAVWRVV